MTNPLSPYRYLIVDVDGVLRRSRQPLPGAGEFLPWIRQRGMDYRIVTNNSMQPPERLSDTFAEMGIVTDARRIITSATGARWLLQRLAPSGARVYIIGEEGIRTALLADGLFTLDEQQADFVVVAIDRQFTYDKLYTACTLIRNGARFIATNTDTTYPTENGVIPGGGSLVAAVQAASGVQPLVIGKPERILLDMAIDDMGARPQETICLGDRLDTDIAGAVAADLASIMVLTGISTRDEAQASPYKPTFIYQDLPHLMRAWEENDGLS